MAARLILQCDWSDALKEAEGRAWISCSKIDCPTVHGELKSHGLNSNGIPHVVPTEGFTVDKITKRSITVSYPDANITTKFVMPLTAFSAIHKKSITSMDISSGGALGVSAAMDGQLLIWQTSDGSIRRDLKGHLGDVNCCRFFPSGVVVLSGGSDMMLKIWSAEDGKCPVTLKGHKGGITDTAMVDRGRNVVSCSRDGTAKLWDCGQSKCLATIECGCIVNSCDLGEANNAVSLGTVQGIANEREVGTEGKLLLLAREDGILQGVGLQSRQSIFEIPGTDSFNCCCMLSTSQVIGGTQDGRIYIIDIRNTSEPLMIIHRSKSPVLQISKHQNGFLASTNDGSCYYMNQESNYVEDFTGSDCDPIYGFGVYNNVLYTACRDAYIRKYAMS